MSAAPRKLTREQEARRSAASMLSAFRRGYRMENDTAYPLLSRAAKGCAVATAKALNDGELARARDWARAYALLEERAERARVAKRWAR